MTTLVSNFQMYFYRNPVMFTVCSRAFLLRDAMLEPRHASPTSCILHAICPEVAEGGEDPPESGEEQLDGTP